MTMLEIIIMAYISLSFAAKCCLRLIKKIENTKRQRQKRKQRKSIFQARSFIRCEVRFQSPLVYKGRGGSLHPIRSSSENIDRQVFFVLKRLSVYYLYRGSLHPCFYSGVR